MGVLAYATSRKIRLSARPVIWWLANSMIVVDVFVMVVLLASKQLWYSIFYAFEGIDVFWAIAMAVVFTLVVCLAAVVSWTTMSETREWPLHQITSVCTSTAIGSLLFVSRHESMAAACIVALGAWGVVARTRFIASSVRAELGTCFVAVAYAVFVCPVFIAVGIDDTPGWNERPFAIAGLLAFIAAIGAVAWQFLGLGHS